MTQTNVPVQGAEIRAIIHGRSGYNQRPLDVAATTAEDGTFAIAGLDSKGLYTLEVEKEGRADVGSIASDMRRCGDMAHS